MRINESIWKLQWLSDVAAFVTWRSSWHHLQTLQLWERSENKSPKYKPVRYDPSNYMHGDASGGNELKSAIEGLQNVGEALLIFLKRFVKSHSWPDFSNERKSSFLIFPNLTPRDFSDEADIKSSEKHGDFKIVIRSLVSVRSCF